MEASKWLRSIQVQLPAEVARAHAACACFRPRSPDDLETAIAAYWDRLRRQAEQAEFLDLDTARRVVAGCRQLLRAGNDPARRPAVQAAIEYYLLRGDAEDDTSIVGFDDDLLVIRVTAEVLGLQLEENRDDE